MKLRINAKLRAALIAAITTVGLTLTQAQAEQQLTLQSTDKISVTNGVGTMTGGNSSLKWEGGSTGAGLSSWKLSLELDPGAGNQDIFNLNASSSASTGYHLHIDGTTSLILRDNSNNELATVALDGRTPITLSFVMNVDEAQTSLGTGTFYLSSGTADPIAASVTQTTGTNNTTFHYGTGSGNGDTRLWTNGGAQKFYTITLTQLDNYEVVVPAAVWKGEEGTNTWVASNFTPEYKSGDDVKFTANGSHTVVVDSAVTAGKMTVTGADYTFAINSNASLGVESVSVVAGASAKLDGEGRYVLADGSAAIGGMQLADTWAGVVAISGAAFADNGTRLNTLNGLSKADSWVALKGTSGWSGGTEISANLLLEKGAGDWAFQQNNGNNNTTLSFTGKIKGDGKLGRGNGTGSTYTYAFSGDISGWTGTFQSYSNDNQSTTFRVSGAATSVKANLVNARGTFKVDVQNSATFDGSVDATELTVAGNQTATFNGTTAIGNGVTLGSGAKLVNGGTLTLGGTVTFGGNAIENNGGTVHFGTNLVFNLDGLTPGEEAGVHTYTLFSGSTTVNLTTLGVSNITLTGGTSGKVWSFSDHGTISWTLPSELEWDNTTGNNKWSYSDTNWHGSAFVENATAQFYQDATVEVSGDIVANAIVVGNGEAAANVIISAGEASSLTATTLQVDNGSLTTNTTIEGLGSNTLAAGTSWHIAADQTIAAGAIDGSVDVAQGKTVTLVQAATAKDLLLGITGAGNIALGTSVSFDSADDAAAASTKATGTLTLKEGVKLTVGNNKDKTASIASFNHVVMEQGAGIDTKSRLVEINDLTVNTDASHTDVIKMLDTYSKDEIGLNLKGTTTLNGNLEINSDWKYKVNIETLAGTGTLTLKGGSNEQHTATIGGGSAGKLVSTSGSVVTSITDTTLGALELTSGSLTANGTSGLGAITIGGGTTLTVAEGATVTATSISVQDNNKATLRINGSLDVSGNFYAIGCSNTTDIIGSGDGSSLTVGSLDICNFGTNFNLQNITMTVSGKANAGDFHNNNKTHIDLNAGSKLNLLGEVTFNTNESKYCTLNVNGGTLTAGIDAEGDTTRVFQNIVAGTNGGTVKFLNGANTVANLDMTAGDLAVTVGEHATLTVADATLRSTITGAVTLTGTVDITNHVISDRTDVYTGGETPGDVNGFRSSAGKMVVATDTVTDEGATYMFGGTDVTSDVVGGVYNVSTETDYTHFYINEGTETLSHAIAGATTLSSVVMSGGTLVADGQSVNLEIAEGAAVTLNVTEETTISSLSGTGSTLYITGDSVVTLAANSSMTSTIDIGGTATVKMGEHEALGNAENSITVHTGATLDINGKDAPAGKLYTLTLAGGTYANTGSELSWGSRQLVKALVVTDDSKVNAESHDFGLINGGYDPTTLDLGATLEKVGSKNFYIVNSTITGDGAFKVTEGGLFFNFNVGADKRGTLAADFLMNGGSVGGTIVLADDISVTAVAGGSTFNAAVINGGHTIIFDGADDLTVGGVISGEGGIIKDGEGTLTLSGAQTYTGTTVVKGGKLVVEGTLAGDSAISVEGDATIGGDVDTTQVGIAAGKTATFEEGIVVLDQGLFFSEGAQVTNNAGQSAKYDYQNAEQSVAADTLTYYGEGGVVVGNQLDVDEIVNETTSQLTLENAETLDLKAMSLGAGATVAVYVTDEQAATEGTVTITESLTAGGGVLLANLTVKGGSMLDMVSLDNELATVTLGSELSFAEDGLVSLSDDVIALLNGMEVDGYWDIFQTYGERELEFLSDYDGAWFDALFNRNGELVNVEGDFQIEATPDHFRLVKNSMVPEPTTGTLSLLALMALAARRRRH